MTCPYISIISPVYQAENLVDDLVEQISSQISTLTNQFEIVLVEDGSQDASWEKIAAQCEKNPRVKGVRLSRNFGQHAAIIAGIHAAKGEWVIIMDCDLQDRPEEAVRLYRKALEGYDVVLAGRTNRQHSLFKRFMSMMFYKVLSWLSGTHYDSRVANFGVYHRRVIDAVLKMRENIPYFTAMVNWVGFKKTVLPVEHAARPKGKTAYSFKRLLKLAINALLVYSDRPLRLIVGLGIAISFSAFLMGISLIYQRLTGTITPLGYTSLITAVFFSSGLIILVLGIIGLYVGKIFEGIKHRPTFLVSEQLNGPVTSPPSTGESLRQDSEGNERDETPVLLPSNTADSIPVEP